MFLERLVIEGIMPEHALGKLKRAGIDVFRVKKTKKNQILLSVKKKDTAKAFAIFPDVCYNISVYSPYTVRPAPPERGLALVKTAKKRMGLFLGLALGLSSVLFFGGYVFKIEITGTDSYRREVLAALESSGISVGRRYDGENETAAISKILTFKDVGYCSLKKSGMTLHVEVRLNAFSEASPVTGDMTAAHAGRILSMAVLRGTPLKQAGDTVGIGDPLVGAYLTTESGDRVTATAIARVTLSCVYEAEIAAEDEQHALANAYLQIDGDITAKSCEQTDSGYFVRVEYKVTESMNL